MLQGLNGILIAGGLSAIVAGGIGLKIGADNEARKCDRKIEAVRKAAEEVINIKLQEILTLEAEKKQAVGEVDKVNATTRKQFEDLQAMLVADTVKREEASVKVEKAATAAARDAREASSRAQAAREAIQNVPEKCAAAGVPDDVVRMLNGILAPAPEARVGHR